MDETEARKTSKSSTGSFLSGIVDCHVNVACPHCDRDESFDDELTARAWAAGHIQEEHPDKLPRMKND